MALPNSSNRQQFVQISWSVYLIYDIITSSFLKDGAFYAKEVFRRI